jgi:hypothetical protein
MAEERKRVAWTLNPKTGEIIRSESFGEELVKQEIVARYDADKQTVFFKSQSLLMKYKTGVITHLAGDEKGMRSFQREDMAADGPITKKIPQRPTKDKMQGDKTPEIVEWYFTYFPNEFCTRYAVVLKDGKPLKYSGPVSYMAPVWRARPGDGQPEFVGQVRKEEIVSDVMVARSKTHITFLPEECLGLDQDDPESFEDINFNSVKAAAVRTVGKDVDV